MAKYKIKDTIKTKIGKGTITKITNHPIYGTVIVYGLIGEIFV